MTFIEAIKSYFKKYVVFQGRARRSEYWFAALFTALVSIAIGIISPADSVTRVPSPLSGLWSLVTFLPSLAIFWRRMHDVGKSGLWFFFALLPIVGWIILVVQLTKDSDSGANQYGEPVKKNS